MTPSGRIGLRREDCLKKALDSRRALGRGTFDPRAACGCVLVALIALLTVASPWTQYYWNFDDFLHSGQDFEFGLLCAILVFCLVLLLTQIDKQGVMSWLELRQWLAAIFQRPDPVASRFLSSQISACPAVSPPDPTLGAYDLPLRI
jgi:hypothetical protein